jgi:hypothetical protein
MGTWGFDLLENDEALDSVADYENFLLEALRSDEIQVVILNGYLLAHTSPHIPISREAIITAMRILNEHYRGPLFLNNPKPHANMAAILSLLRSRLLKLQPVSKYWTPRSDREGYGSRDD